MDHLLPMKMGYACVVPKNTLLKKMTGSDILDFDRKIIFSKKRQQCKLFSANTFSQFYTVKISNMQNKYKQNNLFCTKDV